MSSSSPATMASSPAESTSPSAGPAVSPANSTPVSASQFITEKMRNTRDALLTDGIYLGTADIANKVKWVRVDNGDILVTATTADTMEHAQTDHAADPDENPLPDVPPAILSAVVLITEDDFWMTSCGMWKGSTSACPTFADVKPTCTGGAPNHEVFTNDFRTVCGNVTAIMEQGRTAGFSNIKGIKVNGADGKTKLKFRHILFEVHLIFNISLHQLTPSLQSIEDSPRSTPRPDVLADVGTSGTYSRQH